MYTHLSLIVQSFNLLDDRVAYRRRIPKTITGARHSTRTQSLPLSFLLRRLREKHFATFIRADASSKWKRIALRVHLKERLTQNNDIRIVVCTLEEMLLMSYRYSGRAKTHFRSKIILQIHDGGRKKVRRLSALLLQLFNLYV